MRMGRTGPRIAGALAILIALASGCASSSKSGFIHEGVDFGFIHRCAVLPFHNLTSDEYADDRIQSIFVMEILTDGSLELIGTGEVWAALQEIRVGRDAILSPEQFVAVGKRLEVDAVFFGTVEEYGMDRSGRDRGNEITAVFGMAETQTGVIIWQSQVHVTGLSTWKRLFGGSSGSMHDVSVKCVREALGTLL